MAERHGLLLPGAVETDIERVVFRGRERVVQDRIVVRKAHLAPDHDRQNARRELLALRRHRVRRRGHLNRRRRRGTEIDDDFGRFLGAQRLAVDDEADVPFEPSGGCESGRPQKRQRESSHRLLLLRPDHTVCARRAASRGAAIRLNQWPNRSPNAGPI